MQVQPSHQRQEIGSALLMRGIQRLHEKGCIIVTSGGNESVKPTEKLFNKSGFSDETNRSCVASIFR